MARNPSRIGKQEERNLGKIKELLRLPENKKCFDCPTRSPFFVNLSIQTFICARCSGLVREVGHRIKSISTSKFSDAEVVALQCTGNKIARTIWLSKLLFNQDDENEPETDGDVRLFMRQKYYEQKWLDREKAVAHVNYIKEVLADRIGMDHNTEAKSHSVGCGSKRATLSGTTPVHSTDRMDSVSSSNGSSQSQQQQQRAVTLPTRANRVSLIDLDEPTPYTSSSQPTLISPVYGNQIASISNSGNDNNRPPFQATPSWVDEHVPIGLLPKVKSIVSATCSSDNNRNNTSSADLLSFATAPTTRAATAGSSTHALSSIQIPSTAAISSPLSMSPTNMTESNNVNSTIKNSIFHDLANLNLTDNNHHARYQNESVLQPTTRSNSYCLTASSSLSSITTELLTPSLSNAHQTQRCGNNGGGSYASSPSQSFNGTTADPYATLCTTSSVTTPSLQTKRAISTAKSHNHLFRDLDPLYNKSA